MRPWICAVLTVAVVAYVAGCNEQNVDPVKYPDAWWLGHPDGSLAPDAAPPGLDGSSASDAEAAPDGSSADATPAKLDAGTTVTWEVVAPPAGVSSYKLNAVASSQAVVVAVGDQGAVFQWDGKVWNDLTSKVNVTANLNAVALASPTDWWIAGEKGTVIHWNGTAFDYPSPDSTSSLRSIALDGLATSLWVGGTYGTIYRYDVGTQAWDGRQSTPFGDGGGKCDILALWSSGPTVWGSDSCGVVYKIAGTVWQPQLMLPPMRAILGMWGTGDDDFYVAGDYLFAHVTNLGTGMPTFAGLSTGLGGGSFWRGIAGDGLGNVFLAASASENGLLAWDGKAWRTAAGATGGATLKGVTYSPQAGTWAVGDGIILRRVP